jgi:hypothetical protein
MKGPIVDLFCKTCAKDAAWFKYMVRSVERFASGFRKLVVVDDLRPNLSDEGLIQLIKKMEETAGETGVIVDVEPIPPWDPAFGFDTQQRLEYFWASAVKTRWPEFTDADAVVWIDSDSVFTRPITPVWWFEGERPIWWRVPWTESKDGCAAWKAGVDHLFGVDSQSENMCVSAGLATRHATLALQGYIKEKFGQSVAAYYLDPSHGKLGEFSMVGGYLEHVDACGYVVKHPRDLGEPWPVRQFWSWDPKGPPIDELERILTK